MIMLKSIKSRMITFAIGIVIVPIILIAVFFEQQTTKIVSDAFHLAQISQLDTTIDIIESDYNSLLVYQKAVNIQIKEEQKDSVDIVIMMIEYLHRSFLAGDISENAAKQHAVTFLEEFRYNNRINHFWIQDTGYPFPKMIVNTIYSELNGKIMDNSKLKISPYKNDNVYTEAVEMTFDSNHGYFNYPLWELTQEKGAEGKKEINRFYIKLFEPWNWIVGSSVSDKDIEKEFLNLKKAMIENLNKISAIQSNRSSEHFFIFNENNEFLVHPTRAGSDTNDIKFNGTELKLLDVFKKTAHSTNNFVEYLWDTPEFEGEFRFKKEAHITYRDSLGWYIGTTHYIDIIEEQVTAFTDKVHLFYLIFLFTSLLFFFIISRSIIGPLNNLIQTITKTDKEGLPLEAIPQTQITEIKLLGTSINTMLDSIRRSRKELEIQRDFSRDIVNGSSNVICVLDYDGTTTFINPAGESLTGYNKDEIIGKNWWEMFYPGEEIHQVESLREVMKTGDIINYEMSLLHKDGEKRDLVWNSIIKTDSNNNILTITGFGFDITDRKRLEDRANKIFNNGYDAIYIHDLDGNILDVNDRACSMIGVTKKELFALTIAELSSPELSMDFAAQKWKQALDGDPVVFEWKTVRPLDKYTIDTEISLQRISFYEKDVIVANVRDISERKQAVEALRQSESKFRGLIESTNDWIWEVGADGIYTYSSPQVEDMLGFTPDEIVGKTPFDFMPPDERKKISGIFIALVKKCQPIVMLKNINLHKDGREVILETSAIPYFDSEKNLLGYRGVDRDITEREKSAETLRLQSVELAEANQELTRHKENLEDLVNGKTKELKDSLETLKKTQEELIQREKMASLGLLVAGIAHEINTPVGIGVTSASHLKDKTDEFFNIYKSGKLSRGNFDSYFSIAEESTKMILANLERAADLIHSFKQVAVDQSSQERREFKIKEYIYEILLSLRPQFKKTMHVIEVDCPTEIIINSFPGAFSQILTNLFMNSLNHGFEDIEKGKITIKIIKRDTRVVLSYEDNGRGIPKKNLNKIFEPFFTTKRGQGGSGLGMHIVFNLVTQTLKGTIECRSTEGKGTIFEIEFPFNIDNK